MCDELTVISAVESTFLSFFMKLMSYVSSCDIEFFLFVRLRVLITPEVEDTSLCTLDSSGLSRWAVNMYSYAYIWTYSESCQAALLMFHEMSDLRTLVICIEHAWVCRCIVCQIVAYSIVLVPSWLYAMRSVNLHWVRWGYDIPDGPTTDLRDPVYHQMWDTSKYSIFMTDVCPFRISADWIAGAILSWYMVQHPAGSLP